MIIDKVENISRYSQILKFISEDLSKNEFSKGRFEISGNDYFGIGLEYQTQESEKALWEAHRKYIDIHVILEGEETVYVNDIEYMQSTIDYVEEGDYQLFQGEGKHSIQLKKGYFLLLYPNEVHKTSIKVNEPVSVRKKVFKLKLNS